MSVGRLSLNAVLLCSLLGAGACAKPTATDHDAALAAPAEAGPAGDAGALAVVPDAAPALLPATTPPTDTSTKAGFAGA